MSCDCKVTFRKVAFPRPLLHPLCCDSFSLTLLGGMTRSLRSTWHTVYLSLSTNVSPSGVASVCGPPQFTRVPSAEGSSVC